MRRVQLVMATCRKSFLLGVVLCPIGVHSECMKSEATHTNDGGHTMNDPALTNLRATLAMRVEDTRIAHKHMVEASARVSSPENDAAYRGSVVWLDECRRREAEARGAVIRHLQKTRTTTKRSSELRKGDIVLCHGMRCLIDDVIGSRDYSDGRGGGAVYFTNALVLNRDDVSTAVVPLGFTAERDGTHRWTIQGNDLASWYVEVPAVADEAR